VLERDRGHVLRREDVGRWGRRGLGRPADLLNDGVEAARRDDSAHVRAVVACGEAVWDVARAERVLTGAALDRGVAGGALLGRCPATICTPEGGSFAYRGCRRQTARAACARRPPTRPVHDARAVTPSRTAAELAEARVAAARDDPGQRLVLAAATRTLDLLRLGRTPIGLTERNYPADEHLLLGACGSRPARLAVSGRRRRRTDRLPRRKRPANRGPFRSG
jgi:hypothetical protein